VSFRGRVPFGEVAEIHGRALATVLLLPDRYAAVGQMTQRLIEAVLAGCLPLTPTSIPGAARFTPRQLHVTGGGDVIDALAWLHRIAGTTEHVELITDCLQALEVFRLSRQLDVLDDLLAGPAGREVAAS
jgi:hypothetical protein